MAKIVSLMSENEKAAYVRCLAGYGSDKDARMVARVIDWYDESGEVPDDEEFDEACARHAMTGE